MKKSGNSQKLFVCFIAFYILSYFLYLYLIQKLKLKTITVRLERKLSEDQGSGPSIHVSGLITVSNSRSWG